MLESSSMMQLTAIVHRTTVASWEMADEAHAAPPIAVASAATGAESGAPQHKDNRRARKPKTRAGVAAADAVGAESKQPSKPRARQARGKPQQKNHDAETPDAKAASGETGEVAAASAVGSTKERGAKKPREKSERKPKREAHDKASDGVAPPPAPVDGAGAALEASEKPVAKAKRQPKNAKLKGEEEPVGDAEVEVVIEPVDWKTAAWFTGCDADLGLSHWLLSRCHSCNDVQTLASEAAVRRAVQLNTLLGRLKTELLPVDEEDPTAETRKEWATREILSEVVTLLPCAAKSGDAQTPAKGVAVVTLEGEVIDAATDLLLSRVGKDDLELLQEWETHLEALIKRVEDTSNGGKSSDNDEEGDEVEKEDEEEEKDEEEKEKAGDSELTGAGVEEAAEPGRIEEAAAVLPPPRARKGKGGSTSSIAHAKAQVAAAISFHKAFEQRSAAAASASSMMAVEQWTTEIHRIYESTRVVPSEESSRKGVAAQIESAFRRSPQWRRCEVLLFGSSLSKFGSKTSDLDLCLRANPGNDVEETAAMMSVRELRLRMRRAQQQELSGHGLPNSGDTEDPTFLKETLDKSLKTVEALVNGIDKQRKKTKNKSAAKLKRLTTLIAHWKSLVSVLEFNYKQNPEPTGAADSASPGSSKREAKAAAAAYHDALHKQQKKRQRDIYAAAALLGRNGCDVDLVVAHARIPVIGFTHRATGWECDLCFENYHACINTLLLRTYAEFDDRARALGIAVKHWAKQRGINDASTGHLSSYSFILLTIFFLQTKARILPNLQHPDLLRKANVAPMMLNGVDVSFCADRDQARAFLQAQHPEPSTQNVGELLLAFFEFYVDEFDFSELVSSVRHPERVQTKRVRWGSKNKLKSWRISIEDPLEMDRDLGSVLQFRCQLLILEEMKRALGLLRDGESFETRVCEAVESKKKLNKAEKKKQQRGGGEKPKQNRNDGRGNKPNAKNEEEEKAHRGGRGGRRQDGPDGKSIHQRQQEKVQPNENEKATVSRGPPRARVEKQTPQAAPEDSWRRGPNSKTSGEHVDKKLQGRGRRGDTRGAASSGSTTAPAKSEA